MKRAEDSCMRVVALSTLLFGSSACVVPITVLGGLQPYYSPGDLVREYPDKTHAFGTMGCLDLAPALRESSGTTILDFRMGNRCGDAVTVDLRQMHLYSRQGGEERIPVSLVDPNGEIRPLSLRGRGRAFEPIALRGVSSVPGTVNELCLNLAAIVSAEQGAADCTTLCFVHPEDRWLAASGGRS